MKQKWLTQLACISVATGMAACGGGSAVTGQTSTTTTTAGTTSTTAVSTTTTAAATSSTSASTTTTSVASTTTTTAGSGVGQMTPLSGSDTYTLVYSSSSIGPDQRTATASFATDNTMTGYFADSFEGLQIGNMTNSETSGSANLQIGRWNTGQFAGRYFSMVTTGTTISLSANQGFNYAIAKVPATLPCSGTINYALAAATKPTLDNGSVLPGMLDSLTVSVTFNGAGPHTLQTSGSLTLNGSTITFSGNPTWTPDAAMWVRLNNLTASGGLSDAFVYGVFAGTNAEELGMVLSGMSPGNAFATQVRAAARLTQVSSTAVAC